jgi:hypothetical protein
MMKVLVVTTIEVGVGEEDEQEVEMDRIEVDPLVFVAKTLACFTLKDREKNAKKTYQSLL